MLCKWAKLENASNRVQLNRISKKRGKRQRKTMESRLNNVKVRRKSKYIIRKIRQTMLEGTTKKQ